MKKLLFILLIVFGAIMLGQSFKDTTKTKPIKEIKLDSTIAKIRMQQALTKSRLDSLIKKIKADPEKYRKKIKK